MRRLLAAALLLLAGSAFGASSGSPVGYAARIRSGGTLPATCVSSLIVRDVFYKTGASAGLYVCTAANTWTAQSGASAITGGTCTNQLVSAITAGTGVPTCASVVDAMLSFTAPVLGAPTATTVQTSGNVGFGTIPSATAGQFVLVADAVNQSTQIKVANSNAAGTAANASFVTLADTASTSYVSHGTARTVNRWGAAVGGTNEILAVAGVLNIGTLSTANLGIGTNSTVAISVNGSTQLITVAPAAVTAGTLAVTNSAIDAKVVHRFDWTNAMVTALGAATTGDITVCTLPAKTEVVNAYVVIDTPDTSANALTVALGRASAAFIDYIVASDAKGTANTVYGDAAAERGTNLTGFDLPSITGTTAIKLHFIKTVTNLNTVTASTGHVYLETVLLP